MRTVSDVRPVMVQCPEITLSGYAIAPAQEPARGLILALHGGGSAPGYWDCPVDGGRLSLMKLAAELGYHVLAIDRPGYAASEHFDPARLGLQDQVGFLFDALESWCRALGFDGPTFVIGHSVGGKLALLMAADPRASRLTAVDALGVPIEFAGDGVGSEIQSWESAGTHIPFVNAEFHRTICFGRDGSFSAEALAYDRTIGRPMPVAEYHQAIAMPGKWPTILPNVRIPVQVTMAEDETMQRVGPEMASRAEHYLRNSVYARVAEQKAAGHNASLHHVGRAYHLRALAFFEECIALGQG